MILESEYFHGVGASEAYLLKVSALKLSHPSACPVFQDFSRFSLLRHSPNGERVGSEGNFKYVWVEFSTWRKRTNGFSKKKNDCG
jgi:hypothetical protein